MNLTVQILNFKDNYNYKLKSLETIFKTPEDSYIPFSTATLFSLREIKSHRSDQLLCHIILLSSYFSSFPGLQFVFISCVSQFCKLNSSRIFLKFTTSL